MEVIADMEEKKESQKAVEKKKRPFKKERTKPGIKNTSIKAGLICLACALLVFFVLIIIEKNIINATDKDRVLVIIADVKDGTKITEDNVEIYLGYAERNSHEIPKGAVTDIYQVLDQYVTRDMVTNEIAITSAFEEIDLYGGIESPIEVSIGVSNIAQVVGGTIREGDLINLDIITKNPLPSEALYGTDTNGQAALDTYICSKLLDKVRVTRVFSSNGVPVKTENAVEGSAETATVINIVIPEELEVIFNKAVVEGTIRVSRVVE